MHLRGRLAKHFEGLSQVMPLHVRLVPLFPFEQHRMARAGHRGMRDDLDEGALRTDHRPWRQRRAGLPQRGQPIKLRGDGISAVVPLAMHAQGPFPGRARVIDAVDRIFGETDKSRPRAGRQRVVSQRSDSQLLKTLELLVVRQTIDAGHPDHPLFLATLCSQSEALQVKRYGSLGSSG